MATYSRIEEIPVWQLARELDGKIFKLTKQEPVSKDYTLIRQILGSSGSIMDNIAEGFERSSRLEFVNFLSIAKGSSGEVKSQLYRMLDRKYITQAEFNNTYQTVDEIGRMLMGFIEYLNKTELKGKKFQDRK